MLDAPHPARHHDSTHPCQSLIGFLILPRGPATQGAGAGLLPGRGGPSWGVEFDFVTLAGYLADVNRTCPDAARTRAVRSGREGARGIVGGARGLELALLRRGKGLRSGPLPAQASRCCKVTGVGISTAATTTERCCYEDQRGPEANRAIAHVLPLSEHRFLASTDRLLYFLASLPIFNGGASGVARRHGRAQPEPFANGRVRHAYLLSVSSLDLPEVAVRRLSRGKSRRRRVLDVPQRAFRSRLSFRLPGQTRGLRYRRSLLRRHR